MICKVSEESYEFQRMKELFPFENEFYILVPDAPKPTVDEGHYDEFADSDTTC